jgi:hypothetical protein
LKALLLSLISALAILPATVDTKIHRDHAAIQPFKQLQPCPATGRSTGRCLGYVIDHVKPPACGGADAPSNMQWQTVAEGKAKDKWERIGCSKRGSTCEANDLVFTKCGSALPLHSYRTNGGNASSRVRLVHYKSEILILLFLRPVGGGHPSNRFVRPISKDLDVGPFVVHACDDSGEH